MIDRRIKRCIDLIERETGNIRSVDSRYASDECNMRVKHGLLRLVRVLKGLEYEASKRS